MRRQQHKQETSMFASTRIAVALCAAIAMVLGAMSVGASRHGEDPLSEAPAGAAGSSLASQTSVVEDSNVAPGNSLSVGGAYTPQQPIAAVSTPVQQPLLINPRKPQADVSLGPIKTLINEEKIKIDLDLPVPALAPPVTPVPVGASVTVEAPTVTDTLPSATKDDTTPLQPTTPAPDKRTEEPAPQLP